jgi:5'-nucleotidase/UDP-sugar diphosphatase
VLAQPLEELRTTVVGQSEVDLDGSRDSCRFGECTMGNLIADAMLWATQNDGTQVAIENGGGIRASLPAGDITMGGVLEVLPFGNMLATFGLKGSDLLLALENGVGRAENPDNEGTGRFPQVAGIRFSWDGSKPAGERIVAAEVRGADGSYSPVDPDAVYQIVSNDFNRRGGDEYTVFAENAINPYDFGAPLDQALAAYLTEFSPVNPVVEGRITRVDAAAPEATPTPTEAPTEEPAATATPTEVPVEEPPTELPTTGAGVESWSLLAALLVITALAATQLLRRRESTHR